MYYINGVKVSAEFFNAHRRIMAKLAMAGDTHSKILIEGTPATADDLARLENDLKTGRATAKATAKDGKIFFMVYGG